MSDYIFHVDVTCKGCGRVGRISDQVLIQGRLLRVNKARQFRCTVCGAVGEMETRVGFRESVASDGGAGVIDPVRLRSGFIPLKSSESPKS